MPFLGLDHLHLRRKEKDSAQICEALHAVSTDVGFENIQAETSARITLAHETFEQYQEQPLLKFAESTVDALDGIQSAPIVQAIVSTVMSPEAMQTFQDTVNTLLDGLPGFLQILDDVSRVHPFIAVAVGAFRVAVELDLKRRQNDKKITVLFVEMRDMMKVLVELREIDNPARVIQKGVTLEHRLSSILAVAVQDIKDCANACNAYAKKTTFSKVLNSSGWNGELGQFAKRFTTRRGEFEFALSLYLGRGINAANEKLATVDRKVDQLLEFFKLCPSPEELALAKQIQRCGGAQAVMQNPRLLRDLYDNRSGGSPVTTSTSERRPSRYTDSEKDFKDLQEELQVDPAIAIRDNLAYFERKFALQQRALEEAVQRTVRSEGDRIIDVLRTGPHNRIVDPDIRKIWEEMHWPGDVKARHFVSALRDYFREEFDKLRRPIGGEPVPEATALGQLHEQDEWTLEYINVTRIQPIIEAFDDDASGFITIAEVNAFTTARPADWSLLRWLAYWAIGHQMVMSFYAAKIDFLLAKMFSLKRQVLPANRNYVERYLASVWSTTTELTTAFRRLPTNEVLMAKFQNYIEAEETRLLRNLETFKYDIDARDALELVTGPGRIEKHLFPLLYLLLKRDLEIVRLARTQVLHKDELYDAADIIEWAFDAVQDRYADLSELFKQQNLHPEHHFRIFSFEMFKYWRGGEDFWSLERHKEMECANHIYDDSLEDQHVDLSKILNYPVESLHGLFTAVDFVETDADKQAHPPIRAVLGRWSGYCSTGELYASHPMMSFDLHVTPSDQSHFSCTGVNPVGISWTVLGKCEVGVDTVAHYTFTMTHASRYRAQYFQGTLDSTALTLSGVWGYTRENMADTFILKRLPCEVMRMRPSPAELQDRGTRPKALWHFALNAVMHQLPKPKRGFSFQWTSVAQRRKIGRRYVELLRRKDGSEFTTAEGEELSKCHQMLTPSEARFFYMAYELRERKLLKHINVGCGACQQPIQGARIICVDCSASKNTVDLCDRPECYAQEIGRAGQGSLSGAPHLPSHTVVKARVFLHPHELGTTYRAAKQAFSAAREAFASAEPAACDGSPRCVRRGCERRVLEPCWRCIECEVDTFVCDECDAQHGGISAGAHQASHTLVRYQERRPVEADACPSPLEMRMGVLEAKIAQGFACVDDKIHAVQGGLAGRITTIEERLQRIEEMLLRLLGERSSSEVGGMRYSTRAMATSGAFHGVGCEGVIAEAARLSWV